MGRRIASESKQTVRGGPKPAKVGLHRRLQPDPRVDLLQVSLCGDPLYCTLHDVPLRGRGGESRKDIFPALSSSTPQRYVM